VDVWHYASVRQQPNDLQTLYIYILYIDYENRAQGTAD